MLFFMAICAAIIFVMLTNAKQDIPVAKPEPKPVVQKRYTGYVMPKPPVVDYDNLPYTDALMKRLCRMENKEFFCIDINRINKTALFSGKSCPNGCYHTTLNGCNCPDSAVPCKHMLYLANSLGYLENWKNGLPRERYNNIVETYNNWRHGKDQKYYTGTNNWQGDCPKILNIW